MRRNPGESACEIIEAEHVGECEDWFMTADQKAGAFRLAAKGAPEKKDEPDDDDDDKPDAPAEKAAPSGKAGDAKHPAETAGKDDDDDSDDDEPKTLEAKYEARYPQDVRVSDLVGKPLLEGDNSAIGRVESVAKTADGKVLLIVPYGGFMGFGQHRVAVRLEAVASIGTALISVEQDRQAYDTSPPWRHGTETILHPDDPIRVAITRH